PSFAESPLTPTVTIIRASHLMELRVASHTLYGGGEPLGQDAQYLYYHTDAIGSVRTITDASGQVAARYDYLPFGQDWQPSGIDDPRRFAGMERDAETGAGSWLALNYVGARYYHSQTARFTSVDPVWTIEENLFDPQRWNRYAYVRNN